MPFIDRLITLAQMWAKANDRSTSRLATIVANDGKFFERLSSGGTCTVTVLEKFIAFFSDASNWPAGIPEDTQLLLQGFGTSGQRAVRADP